MLNCAEFDSLYKANSRHFDLQMTASLQIYVGRQGMLKKRIAFCFMYIFSAVAMAEQLNVHADAPSKYIVKKGDTLWDISGMYLERPWLWPMLWQKNPEIENPHLIYPGDVLRLEWVNGKPVLKKTSVKQPTDLPINGISQAILKRYLTYDALISQDILSLAPRVLGDQKGARYISMRESFFVDTVLDSQDWFIYRVEEEFKREIDGQPYRAYSVIKVAQASRVAKGDGFSEMKLTRQFQEVRPNDILLPAIESKTGNVVNPNPAPLGLDGEMIGHLHGAKYVGLRQIVVLDRGDKDGLAAGNVFSVKKNGTYLKGKKGQMRYETSIDSPLDKVKFTMPSKDVATLLVIRSYAHFSLAMVVTAEEPLAAPMMISAAGG